MSKSEAKPPVNWDCSIQSSRRSIISRNQWRSNVWLYMEKQTAVCSEDKWHYNTSATAWLQSSPLSCLKPALFLLQCQNMTQCMAIIHSLLHHTVMRGYSMHTFTILASMYCNLFYSFITHFYADNSFYCKAAPKWHLKTADCSWLQAFHVCLMLSSCLSGQPYAISHGLTARDWYRFDPRNLMNVLDWEWHEEKRKR